MKIGTACAIFLQINSEKYTDEEKGTAILEVLKMPTHIQGVEARTLYAFEFRLDDRRTLFAGDRATAL